MLNATTLGEESRTSGRARSSMNARSFCSSGPKDDVQDSSIATLSAASSYGLNLTV